ncbi:MAG: AEC family transporter, partial [Clostridia bacterium]|nr:AEC family transporter [Clostridia bacterium]
KRVWLVAFLRLIMVPLIMIPLLKFTGVAQLVPNGGQVLLVVLLATMTPSASTITQFAQVFDKDAEYASSINVLTTLLCVVTIPLMVTLYQM